MAREIAAARGVRRSNARGVRAPPMSQDSRCTPWHSAGVQLAAAVVLHDVTGGRSRQLPEGSNRMRRAKWRLFGLYVKPHSGATAPDH